MSYYLTLSLCYSLLPTPLVCLLSMNNHYFCFLLFLLNHTHLKKEKKKHSFSLTFSSLSPLSLLLNFFFPFAYKEFLIISHSPIAFSYSSLPSSVIISDVYFPRIVSFPFPLLLPSILLSTSCASCVILPCHCVLSSPSSLPFLRVSPRELFPLFVPSFAAHFFVTHLISNNVFFFIFLLCAFIFPRLFPFVAIYSHSSQPLVPYQSPQCVFICMQDCNKSSIYFTPAPNTILLPYLNILT